MTGTGKGKNSLARGLGAMLRDAETIELAEHPLPGRVETITITANLLLTFGERDMACSNTNCPCGVDV